MTLSQKSHNKVKIGQPVVINLQANSQNPIKGYVTYISQIIDKEGNFTVKAAFVKGQTDSFGQLTDFRNEQRGSGSIIINRRSLLTKILRLK